MNIMKTISIVRIMIVNNDNSEDNDNDDDNDDYKDNTSNDDTSNNDTYLFTYPIGTVHGLSWLPVPEDESAWEPIARGRLVSTETTFPQNHKRFTWLDHPKTRIPLTIPKW